MSISSWEAYYERQQERDYPDVRLEAHERRRSRKPRTCSWCRKAIKPGDTYIRSFAIVDEEPEWSIYCSTPCRQRLGGDEDAYE